MSLLAMFSQRESTLFYEMHATPIFTHMTSLTEQILVSLTEQLAYMIVTTLCAGPCQAPVWQCGVPLGGCLLSIHRAIIRARNLFQWQVAGGAWLWRNAAGHLGCQLWPGCVRVTMLLLLCIAQ
jgi:hypothetical protein